MKQGQWQEKRGPRRVRLYGPNFLTADRQFCMLFVDGFVVYGLWLTAFLFPIMQLFQHLFQLLRYGQAEVGGILQDVVRVPTVPKNKPPLSRVAVLAARDGVK